MGIWNQFGRLLVGAVDSAVDFQRKKAQNQRLKETIKKENIQINRVYLALGKRYYADLRGKTGDEAADRLCTRIDYSQERMRKARKRLVDLRSGCACSVATIGRTDQPVEISVHKEEHVQAPLKEQALDARPEMELGHADPESTRPEKAQAEQPQNREAADESEEWIPPLPDSVKE